MHTIFFWLQTLWGCLYDKHYLNKFKLVDKHSVQSGILNAKFTSIRLSFIIFISKRYHQNYQKETQCKATSNKFGKLNDFTDVETFSQSVLPKYNKLVYLLFKIAVLTIHTHKSKVVRSFIAQILIVFVSEASSNLVHHRIFGLSLITTYDLPLIIRRQIFGSHCQILLQKN